MNISEQNVRNIVSAVLANLNSGVPAPGPSAPLSSERPASRTSAAEGGVFGSVDAAVGAAKTAFTAYRRFGLKDRKKFIDEIRKLGVDRQVELSRMVFDETKMGRYEHKLIKHVNAALRTPGVEDLETRSWSGDNGLAVEEYAPFGVIGVITPSTHPSETIINNTIMMLAAGNTLVCNPHPSAKNVSAHVTRLINAAMTAVGAPPNLLTLIGEPTIESAQELFRHKDVSLLSITGGPAVVREAMKSDKKVIAAGPGNPPVVVDETADLSLAAERITTGASFDNNILCFAEKEVFVVAPVFDAFMKAMEKTGAVRLDRGQVDRLAETVFEKKKYLHLPRREFVGRNASVLAKSIGLDLPDSVPLLFGETTRDHVFVQEEQLMPFLPVVRVRDFDEGVAAALEAEHDFGHSASVFTQNMKRATDFARQADCSIFVINGGTFQGDGGEYGEGNMSYTIATPTGEAITRPRDFARTRRIMIAGSARFV